MMFFFIEVLKYVLWRVTVQNVCLCVCDFFPPKSGSISGEKKRAIKLKKIWLSQKSLQSF